MPQLEGLRVVLSKIHGYGVIATRRFRAGDIVVVGDGVVYREDQEFDDTYALILPAYRDDGTEDDDGANLYYDLADQTRWINHSCDPNTEIDSKLDPATGSITAWWVALRDIEPGEELTYDYAFSGHLAERCACGARNCRGVIVDEDEVHLVPSPLRDHVAQWLRPRLRA